MLRGTPDSRKTLINLSRSKEERKKWWIDSQINYMKRGVNSWTCQHRYHGYMNEVFKYFNRKSTTKIQSCKPRVPPSARRSHDLKLQKRHCFTQCSSNFFYIGVVNSWNRLPNEVVSSPTLNTFKGCLDKYWGHACYTMNVNVFIGRISSWKRQHMISQKITLA